MRYSKLRATKKRVTQPAGATASHCSYRTVSEVPAFSSHMSATGTLTDTLVAEPKTQVKRPAFYKVVLLNDDYTPMDFVVSILETVFRKTHEEAVQIMFDIHKKGAAVCGIFTRDIAETKADQVVEVARVNDYPLQCVIEQE